jgi:type II secretory pathway component GspD/PulD (secretin)
MPRFALSLALCLAAAVLAPLQASMAVATRKSGDSTLISLAVEKEKVVTVAAKISSISGRSVEIVSGASALVTFSITDASARATLDALGKAAGMYVLDTPTGVRLQHAEPGVTLDVKDADIRKILQSMKEQCGIRNLMIDPEVQGTGTFLFNDVPCSDAFGVVTRTMGLAGEFSGNVANVAPRH